MTASAVWKVLGIRGAIAIALAALALWCWIGWGNAAASRDGWQEKAILAERKLSISNQSIASLEGALSRYVGAGKAARVKQLAAIEAQAEDSARLQAQADAIRAEMETMAPDGLCQTPDSIKEADL